jgi:hypothetical protein
VTIEDGLTPTNLVLLLRFRIIVARALKSGVKEVVEGERQGEAMKLWFEIRGLRTNAEKSVAARRGPG